MEVIDTNLNGLFLMTQRAGGDEARRHDREPICRLPLSAFSPDQRLNAIEQGVSLYEYVAGRVASKWNSGDRADARRDRYRNWDTLWRRRPGGK